MLLTMSSFCEEARKSVGLKWVHSAHTLDWRHALNALVCQTRPSSISVALPYLEQERECRTRVQVTQLIDRSTDRCVDSI